MKNKLTLDKAVEEYNKLMPPTFWLKLGTPIPDGIPDGSIVRPISIGYYDTILATTLINQDPAWTLDVNAVERFVRRHFGADAGNFRQLADFVDPEGASDEA